MLNIQNDTQREQIETGNSFETVITKIFQAWTEAHIDFVILRNYANLPADPGNDLDILVDPHKVLQAETILAETAASLRYRMYNRAEFACTSLYFISESNHPLHIDLFTEFTWRGFCFFSGTFVLKNRVSNGLFYIPHPTHEATLNLLTRLLYHGYVHEKYKTFIYNTFRNQPELTAATLSSAFGIPLATKLLKAVIAKDWKLIEVNTWPIRLQLIKRQVIRHPVVSTQNLFNFFLRLIKRFLHPPGLFIILLGPDGSGKSTLAHRLIEKLGSRFFVGPGLYFHWKSTPLFKAKSSQNSISQNPHGAGSRNFLFSLCFFLYHWFDFFFDSLVRLRPHLFSNKIIIFDRYYHDFEVDQKRYRLKVPQTVIKLGKYFLRPPDLIFGLVTSPDILQSRKNEVSWEETMRQGDAYVELVNTQKNGYVIDASNTPQEIENKVQLLIMDFMVKRANSSFLSSNSST